MPRIGTTIALILALAPDISDGIAQAVADYMDEHGTTPADNDENPD